MNLLIVNTNIYLTSVYLSFNYCGMVLKFYIQCERHRITRANPQKVVNDSIQQPGTYVQQAHGNKNVKGCSHAASKKCTIDD